MSAQNNKFSIYLPFLFALVLITGIFLGVRLRSSSIRTDDNKVNDIIRLVKDNYVDTVSSEALIGDAVNGMLQALDPHSVYLPASEFKEANESLEGNFEGIGVQFRIENDTIIVVNTVPKGPSEKTGISAGDRIVRINDTCVAKIKITNEQVMKKLKGQKGTKVKVGIFRRGVPNLLDFIITRDVIPTYCIDAAYMVQGNIGYIRLNKFSASTMDEFHQAVSALQNKGMKKLILDLRENGGGYLQSAIDLADEFLPDKTLIVYTEGRHRKTQNAYATSKGSLEKCPLVILIDESSASASEILAGAIQDNDRGLIIGRRSFGKGLVQEQIKLDDGSAVRLTVSRYHTPTGRCIQRPYRNGYEKYYLDYYNSLLSDETDSTGTIVLPDSLKYKTPEGKTVYGGGGIMPDIYVPVKKSRDYLYLNNVSNRGLMYRYAFDYTDKKRDYLKKTYNSETFIRTFVISDNELNDFFVYAGQNGVKRDDKCISATKDVIRLRLKSYIARNLFDDEAFYKIINPRDDVFMKALEEMIRTK